MIQKLITILVIILIPGCAYHVLKPKNLITYRIVSIVNHTTEPAIEDKFIKVFKEEAQRFGFRESNTAEIEFEISIEDFQLHSLSVIDSLVAEYTVSAKVAINYTTRAGKKITKRFSTEFIESFLSSQDINLIEANKERLISKALREIASRAFEEIIVDLSVSDGINKTA